MGMAPCYGAAPCYFIKEIDRNKTKAAPQESLLNHSYRVIDMD
jgi:hypothetical protein